MIEGLQITILAVKEGVLLKQVRMRGTNVGMAFY